MYFVCSCIGCILGELLLNKPIFMVETDKEWKQLDKVRLEMQAENKKHIDAARVQRMMRRHVLCAKLQQEVIHKSSRARRAEGRAISERL